MISRDIIDTCATLAKLADSDELTKDLLAKGLNSLIESAERVAEIELRPIPIPLREQPDGDNVVVVNFPRPPHLRAVAPANPGNGGAP